MRENFSENKVFVFSWSSKPEVQVVAGVFALMKSGSTWPGETANFTFGLAESPAICASFGFQAQRGKYKV